MNNSDIKINYLFELIRNHKWKKFIEIINKNDELDYNLYDSNGNYFITYAVKFNNPFILKFLLSKDCRIDILDSNERCILYESIENDYYEITNILLEHNSKTIGIQLVDIRDNNDNIPLHYAIKKNNLNTIKLLIKYNSNVNFKDKYGYNSLHIAVRSKSFDICNEIIKYINNIDDITTSGETALHISINFQYNDLTKLLINKKANINKVDNNNKFSPLHYAITWNNYEIIIELLKNNADVNLQDIYGNTALIYTIKEDYLNIFNILKNYQYNANLWNIDGRLILHEVLIKESENNDIYINELLDKTNLIIQDSDGMSCLHYLVKLNIWKQYINILETKKLNIFLKNLNGKMPIDYISTEDIDYFIDMIVNGYMYSLQNEKKNWINEIDLICSRNLKDLSTQEKKKLNINSELNSSDTLKQCKLIIKNKIINIIELVKNNKITVCESSYPLYIKNPIDINLNNVVNVCTFTGSTMDVLFGLIYLLQKHKNTCTVLGKNHIKNTKLCKFYKSLGLIMRNKCEFINFEIVWIQYKLFIIDNFQIMFKKCLDSDAQFIIIPIGIEMKKGAHAGYLIYDKIINEIERFEPHGKDAPNGFNYDPNMLDDILEMNIKDIDSSITYIRPSQYLPTIGFQILDIHETDNSKIGDPGGFCAPWCIWYVDQRITYNNYDRNSLIDNLINSIRSNGISFREMIRNYTYEILKIRDKVLNSAGIEINDWLNDQYTNTQLNTILNNINKEIESTCYYKNFT